MGISQLHHKFSALGARLKINEPMKRPRWFTTQVWTPLAIDIRQDKRGEYFSLTCQDENVSGIRVIDCRPSTQHLLLLAEPEVTHGGRQKFLCGHDERHWFVAGVPDRSSASNVYDAMDALKPAIVKAEQARKKLRYQHRHKRHNKVFKRQGEWFFLPRPDLLLDTKLVLRNEPLSRGASSKPHMVEELIRFGGELVYVSKAYPAGATETEYRKWRKLNPNTWIGWRTMRRNPGVYARGRVRHPDHETMKLNCWHQVSMNTEDQSSAMRHVAFLD